MTTRYPHVFQPFAIAGVTLRNRVFIPGHTTNFAEDFLPTPRHVAYQRERAQGGVGLIIVEPLRVHRSSLGRAGGLSGERAALPGLRAITDVIKTEGVRVFAQITHTGRHGDNFVDRLPPWGPSAVPWTAGGDMPHAMTRSEMVQVLDAFLDTARMVVDAGFEGMEVHLGHGHLLHQFLSPASNIRTDDWGGSFDARLRYPLEVLRAVVAEVGHLVPVGIRVSVDDLMQGGLDQAASLEITRQAAAIPGVAFVNASVAAYQWPSIGHHVADMNYPPHPFLDQTVALRQVIGSLPLLTANRYTSLADAERGLATGAVDMIGMNRAHMADPAVIAKTLAGQEDDIRPCVSGNFCIGQIAVHRPISCMMNPRVGKEEQWPETPPRTATPRRVLVVGGGPAGLEAARVAAQAGHAVTLWERDARLGGALILAGTGYGRGDLHRMRDYLDTQLRRTSAVIVTDKAATAGDICGFGADVVILAIGGQEPPLPDWAHGVPTIESALAADRTGWNGGSVAILDDSGSWATLSAAETLARAGAAVTVVCRPDSPFWDVNIYSRMTAMERLASLGVRLRPGLGVQATTDGTIAARNKFTGDAETLTGFDRILRATHSIGASDLQDTLERRGQTVRSVGDALAPHSLFEAVHDGHAAGRTV
ncbi:MAG: FAD-dependent oxidoreductase [Gemmobacter sp.]|nr:FAD-dependent oxidoreductase [Gemmobacter sp.]